MQRQKDEKRKTALPLDPSAYTLHIPEHLKDSKPSAGTCTPTDNCCILRAVPWPCLPFISPYITGGKVLLGEYKRFVGWIAKIERICGRVVCDWMAGTLREAAVRKVPPCRCIVEDMICRWVGDSRAHVFQSWPSLSDWSRDGFVCRACPLSTALSLSLWSQKRLPGCLGPGVEMPHHLLMDFRALPGTAQAHTIAPKQPAKRKAVLHAKQCILHKQYSPSFTSTSAGAGRGTSTFFFFSSAHPSRSHPLRWKDSSGLQKQRQYPEDPVLLIPTMPSALPVAVTEKGEMCEGWYLSLCVA